MAKARLPCKRKRAVCGSQLSKSKLHQRFSKLWPCWGTRPKPGFRLRSNRASGDATAAYAAADPNAESSGFEASRFEKIGMSLATVRGREAPFVIIRSVRLRRLLPSSTM